VQKPCRVASSRNRFDPRRRASAAAGFCLLTALGAAPAAELLRGTFDLSADVLNSDLRSDTMELLGNVRLAQDAMSIEAAQAHAAAFRSDNSRWSFERSVRLRTAEADLKADTAKAAFVNGQISTARVEGSPAEFEQRGGPPDRQVRGRAATIDYDFGRGVVTLVGDVWFGYGKDEFSCDTVVYSMRDERVNCNQGSTTPGRVRGTIRPRPRPEPPATQPAQPPGNGA
jgi:lipopolysaccharide transport protein LptA